MSKNLTKYSYVTQHDYENIANSTWPPYSVFQQHQNIPDFVYEEIDKRLTPPKIFNHPAFCVLPFYGWEYPANTPCCLLKPPVNLESIRQDMLNGIQPKSCQKCWDLEAAGTRSDRQLKNETLDFYLNQDIQSIFEDCKQGKNQVNHYKIDTSNTCNSTCVTCGSLFSSAWKDLETKNQKKSHRHWSIQPNEADQFVNYKTAKFINFRGGEPLLSKTNFYIIEKLIEFNNTDCFISFQTNGSVRPTSEQEKLLGNLKKINFSFSIDGTDRVFEYLRYPLKWSTITENIAWCRERNIEVSANYTISNLNVFYHKQTIKWFQKNNINYQINMVYNPAWFSPSALPASVKSKIDFEFVESPNDQTNYLEFRKKIAEQDAWKDIKMKDYLPELAKQLG